MEDTVLKPKPGWERHPTLDTPEPLTDTATPWLAKDPGTAITGLDPDGRVPIEATSRRTTARIDVLRLAWAVALGYASPHIATLGRDLVVVSGAESGSLDISQLDAVRLRNLCASGLTYCHHVEETREKDADGNELQAIEEWDEPALPTMQLCRHHRWPTRPSGSTGRCWPASPRCPCCVPTAPCWRSRGSIRPPAMIYWPDLPIGADPG